MIQIRTQEGEWLRTVPADRNETVEYHKTYGFVTKSVREERARRRARGGLRVPQAAPEFAFEVRRENGNVQVIGGPECTITKGPAAWNLNTPKGAFTLSLVEGEAEFITAGETPRKDEDSKLWNALPLLAVVILGAAALFNSNVKVEAVTETKPEVVPVVVQVENRTVVPIEKPKPVEQPREQKNQALDKTAQVKKALTQNLGFLKLMGRKDLKKAMGGLPTNVPDASPGAGPGGKEGSGGELLVGLGQGLRRTTVGNSGLAGLGGVGTKGAGGGLGGYGETDLGGGGGKSISTVPLSQDAVIEGGLDRALIQATILRYLSQVRACYEEGLKRKADMIGQVTMNFEINGAGAMNFSRVQRSSLGDKDVEDCISKRMMHWKFPAP
ncbi:MAG TPA: AgmX/PglI C-terminal domain-containing protein, partial [Bdellovibrionales bacterium]|nr:AgmX/PglI C-terminal domain-containing protein [Bdellovibrionales bacterium]